MQAIAITNPGIESIAEKEIVELIKQKEVRKPISQKSILASWKTAKQEKSGKFKDCEKKPDPNSCSKDA